MKFRLSFTKKVRDGDTYRVLPSLSDRTPATYMAIPERDIPQLVARYVAAMETEKTDQWCRCEWKTHPDDIKIAPGNCRDCNRPAKGHSRPLDASDEVDGVHHFRGKRMKRGDQAWDCPVHTKEGLLLYFFEWVYKQ